MKKEMFILLLIVFFSGQVLGQETASLMQIQSQGINHTIKLNEIYENAVLITVDDKTTKTILLNTTASWLKSDEWPADKPVFVGDLAISVDQIVNSPSQGQPYASLLLGLTNITLVEGEEAKNITFNGINHTLKLKYISSSDIATLSIDGLLKSYDENNYFFGIYYYYRTNNSLTISLLNATQGGAVNRLDKVALLILKTINLTRYQPSNCLNQCAIQDETRCASTKVYQVCGNFDEDSCLEWGGEVICQNDEICSDGACIAKTPPTPSCINQCKNVGEKTCDSNSAYKICNNDSEKNCLGWSNSISCAQDQICKNGNCVEIQKEECEKIGLRESGKYCSTEYKLIIQKANSISCDNDFECKTNNCLENKCASKVIPSSPNNKIIWIIIIALVIIIIGLIVYFLRPKNNNFN